MGSWFSNFHIRKNGTVTVNSVSEYICQMMFLQRYLLAASEDEADGTFAILSDDKSQWYSVYSDLFAFDEPSTFAAYATPMSEKLETDILGISCFDSDYLYLNLINAAGNVDAWAGIGSTAGLGIRRRTNLSAWKQKVDDYLGFKEHVKNKYVFAEDVLEQIEHCIRLPEEYSTASYEYLAEMELDKTATYLYFKLPEEKKDQDPPKLVEKSRSLVPCFIGKRGIVNGTNVGGASKGLSVYFVGPYVEHEEITFSDIYLKCGKDEQRRQAAVELKKVQLPDGQWAYWYHNPGFKIPPKADERLPITKQIRVEWDREISVHFIPHGNPRKVLDITVVLVPDKNPEGWTSWNVWHEYGSKKAFIEHYNEGMRKNTYLNDMVLKEEDYD